jgi:hypothetical protein
MTNSEAMRVQLFCQLLDQVTARVEDVVPPAVLVEIKTFHKNLPSRRELIRALWSIENGFKYFEYISQIGGALLDPPVKSPSIPEDLRSAMIAEFERVSSRQVHLSACINQKRQSFPPIRFVARKLAIEFGAASKVIALFPESNSVGKRAMYNAYWDRLRSIVPI